MRNGQQTEHIASSMMPSANITFLASHTHSNVLDRLRILVAIASQFPASSEVRILP